VIYVQVVTACRDIDQGDEANFVLGMVDEIAMHHVGTIEVEQLSCAASMYCVGKLFEQRSASWYA
jgi:hypothetical protein